jgi:hypothetical protein
MRSADLWIVPLATSCFEDRSSLDRQDRTRIRSVPRIADAVPPVLGLPDGRWRACHDDPGEDRGRSVARCAGRTDPGIVPFANRIVHIEDGRSSTSGRAARERRHLWHALPLRR